MDFHIRYIICFHSTLHTSSSSNDCSLTHTRITTFILRASLYHVQITLLSSTYHYRLSLSFPKTGA